MPGRPRICCQGTHYRGGVAFDIADLMAYEEHQKIVDGLLTEYLRPAPLGYADITIEQLSRTDLQTPAVQV